MHRPSPPPSPLLDYLTGRPTARANPGWRLERRRAEGGAWERVGAPPSRALALDEMRAPLFAWGPGDVVVLRSGAGTAWGTWGGTRRGLEFAGPVPRELGRGADWVEAWEGPAASGPALVHALPSLDPCRRVLAVAEALAGLPPACAQGLGRAYDAGRTARAVEAARGWARGEAEAGALRLALRLAEAHSADLARENPVTDEALAAARACTRLLRLALDPGPRPEALAWQALDDVRFVLGEEGPGPLAARVRRWVPLPVALLALAGEPTPLQPDL